jgi:hypothetical protein
MNDKPSVRVDTGFGIIWFIGWMFTLAFAKLSFGKAILALLIWPYHLGAAVRG